MNEFEIRLYSSELELSLMQNDYVLLFVVHGNMQVNCLQTESVLHADDFLLLNSNRPSHFSVKKDTLVMACSISGQLIHKLSDSSAVYFRCDSSRYSSVKYEQLRSLIHDLLGECSLGTSMTAKKLSILYRICDSLLNSFKYSIEPAKHGRAAANLDPVFQYINSNYMDNISLSDAAARIYVAPQSLSRLFSQSTGMTFTQYVTGVRLERAAELLLTSTMPLLDISLHCGFNTYSQFNKVFRKRYDLSPGEFRTRSTTEAGNPNDRLSGKSELSSLQETTTDPGEILDQLKQFQTKTRLTIVKEQKTQLQSVSVDTTHSTLIKNPWNHTLFLGFASKLLSGSYQKHILSLKKTLHFQFGSINGLFSPEMHLTARKDKMNFVNLDQVLDFLVENGIKPIIVLDNQVLHMLKSLEDIEEIKVANLFDDIDELCMTIRKILDHIVSRYGLSEVSNWKFTVWYYVYKKNLMGLNGRFIDNWDRIYKTIKEKIPDVKVGGCNYSPSVKREPCVKFYRDWTYAEHMPDYLTCTMFPYQEAENQTKMNPNRMNIEQFSLTQLEQYRNILEDAGFPECPILVQEWNISFIQRNSLNDMAGKAAIMVKQMADLLGEVDTVCYWYASDILAGDYDADQLLNGSCGLISADGIRKPSYYAMFFFSHLLNRLVARGDHYLVTKDSLGHFAILLYNNKSLTHTYYSKDESAISINDEAHIFRDQASLELTLTLTGVENRTYHIRKQIFGPSSGSVLDEWGHLGIDYPLSMDDLSYLRQRCVPLLKNERTLAQNNMIILPEVLQAHEIMLLEIG